MVVQIQLRRDTAANWTAADPTLAEGELGVETDTGQFKFGDGATAWTGLSYSSATVADIVDLPTAEMDDTLVLAPDGAGGVEFRAETGGGLTDPPTITYIDGTGAAAPGNPGSGDARLYAKTDGRWYSRDNGGVEYGPFDAAGGGGTLYLYDELFPGSSLPAGWAFTGSGTCVVSGGVATVTAAAQSDRLMFAYTPTGDITVIRAHLQNVSGEGGMPSLVVLDSGGLGYGVGPYNDGNVYSWTVAGSAYQYSGTNTLNGAAPGYPGEPELWLSVLLIDGVCVGTGFSTDGVAWTGKDIGGPSQRTITQVGVCQLWTSANIVADLAELTITEP